jgi:hypothetical protein
MARKKLESANAPANPPEKPSIAPQGLHSFASVHATAQHEIAAEPQTTSTPRPRGRPFEFDAEVFAEICERIADGETLVNICERDQDERSAKMPARSTFRRWMRDRPDLRSVYTRAREDQMHSWSDEVIGIADDGTADTILIRREGSEVEVKDKDWIERSKLRVETRLKLMAKLLPKVYGDKIEQTVNSTVTQFTIKVGDGSVAERQEKRVGEESARVTFNLPPPAQKSADEIIEENL